MATMPPLKATLTVRHYLVPPKAPRPRHVPRRHRDARGDLAFASLMAMMNPEFTSAEVLTWTEAPLVESVRQRELAFAPQMEALFVAFGKED